MSSKLNKPAYEKLIKEDIEWLESNSERSLEREHIVSVLKHSVDCYYPTVAGREYTCPDCGASCDGNTAHRIASDSNELCHTVRDRRGGWRQLGVYDG